MAAHRVSACVCVFVVPGQGVSAFVDRFGDVCTDVAAVYRGQSHGAQQCVPWERRLRECVLILLLDDCMYLFAVLDWHTRHVGICVCCAADAAALYLSSVCSVKPVLVQMACVVDRP